MASTHAELPDIVRLQLRKPVNWNWKISLCKSSPNIILPVIQLFDCKKQLLVETGEDENLLQSCWGSTLNCSNTDIVTRQYNLKNVRRSRSDTVVRNKQKGKKGIENFCIVIDCSELLDEMETNSSYSFQSTL